MHLPYLHVLENIGKIEIEEFLVNVVTAFNNSA